MINCLLRSSIFALLFLSILVFSSFTSCSESPIIEFKYENQFENATIEPKLLDVSTSSYEEKSGDAQVIKNVSSSKPKLYGIQNLPSELILLISDYLVNPLSSLGSINLEYYDLFHRKLSLKYLFKRYFDIPELENVDETEPELAGILSLERYRNDPFALFFAIVEDIFSGKRPYKNISRGLIEYLARSFKKFRNVTEVPLIKREYHFWSLLSDFSANSDNFDFVFDFNQNNHKTLLNCLRKVKNKKSLMEFLKANPFEAKEYHLAIISEESSQISNLAKIFVEYIIYDAPGILYGNVFASTPVLREISNYIKSDFFLFQDIPDSEYSRIHSQIKYFFEIYWSQNLINNLEFFNLFIDLRFGVLDQLNVIDFDKESLVLLAKAALLGNKPDIFFMINDHYNENIGTKYEIILSIMDIFTREDVKLSAVHKLNPIFELIACDPEFFTARKCIDFLVRFYALNDLCADHLGLAGAQNRPGFDLEFVAFDNLLSVPKICFYNQRDFAPCHIQYAFTKMKVLNAKTLGSLMYKYNEYFLPERIEISFEVIEVLANNPSLIRYFRKYLLKIYGGFDVFKKYLDLPNFDETICLFEPTKLRGFIISTHMSIFKSKKSLERIEKMKMQNNTIADFYLEYESEFPCFVNNTDYHEWRFVFAYWIKSDQKERIKDIKNPYMIKMLKIEFPDEMKQIMNT